VGLVTKIAEEITETFRELLKDQGGNIKQLADYLKIFNDAILSRMESM
jgi:hypothetical protein